eukprot:TRINITY_DN2022_c0_g1_i2.p1 TRINITY_DN2022_c0_g1~~TRINITY_DN2022_c0_g1_i2.p1  ORF type:complete len:137 (-),score=26.62 TRINITY_DN2022_c0_g1_i2:71-448(-)
MSWQDYVKQLTDQGLNGAAILGNSDGGVWSISNTLTLKAGEGRALADLFKNPSNVFVSGITINGEKYMGIKGDQQSIYGKKGQGGIVTAKTNQGIVVGRYNETVQPGNAALYVEKLADYIRDNGY